MSVLIPVTAGYATAMGERSRNQDRFAVVLPWAFVLDGVGGSEDGGVAAQLALANLISDTAEGADQEIDEELMRKHVENAHIAVASRLVDLTGHARGATTLTAAHLQVRVDGKVTVTVGAVGDSPAWVVSKGSVPVRLTRSTRATGSSYLSDALGWPDHSVDIAKVTLTGHSRVLLATDGIEATEQRTRDRIAADLGLDPQTCASRLVTATLKARGRDNVSVVVIDVCNAATSAATEYLRGSDLLTRSAQK